MHLFRGRHRGLLAAFAATVLGIAITLYTIPQIQTKVLTSDADAWYSSTRDYFRLWHPPWAPQHHVRASHVFDESKTPCQKTLLYRFAGAHGFASEYLIFLRVAMLAEHFGYHLLLDDSRWNYGRWAE